MTMKQQPRGESSRQKPNASGNEMSCSPIHTPGMHPGVLLRKAS